MRAITMSRDEAPSIPSLYSLCGEKIISSGLFATVEPGHKPNELTQLLQRKLLQAVIDDDGEFVTALLSAHPDLLVGCSLRQLVQSQYTWQTFESEPALMMALKRNQTDMLGIIVKAVETAGDKLTAEQRENIMQQWEDAEASLPSSIKRSQEFDFQSLIDVIKRETFLNGLEGRLSEETETALQKFREALLPRGAIKLDDYCEIMHLLLAVYQAYDQVFYQFQGWPQRDVFCIKVIGYIQSLLPVEIAKVFCEGLYSVVKQNRPISARAANLQFSARVADLQLHGVSALRLGFYRLSLDDEDGLGFRFLADVWGGRSFAGGSDAISRNMNVDCRESGLLPSCVRKLCQEKTTEIGRLKGRMQNCLQPHSAERSRTHNTSCLIL